MFTNAGNTVSATLTFDAAGDLVGFLSNDRMQEDARGEPQRALVHAHFRSIAYNVAS
jgi:hypothetical protein